MIYALAGVCTCVALVGNNAIFIFFIEDWAPIGADAQSFAAVLGSIAGVCTLIGEMRAA